VSVKTPAAFQITNEINGFEHISYGTALKIFGCFMKPSRLLLPLFLAALNSLRGAEPAKPNVIVMIADDLGYEDM